MNRFWRFHSDSPCLTRINFEAFRAVVRVVAKVFEDIIGVEKDSTFVRVEANMVRVARMTNLENILKSVGVKLSYRLLIAVLRRKEKRKGGKMLVIPKLQGVDDPFRDGVDRPYGVIELGTRRIWWKWEMLTRY